MLDVMLDLETMGTGPRAAIIAIGAVPFDLEEGTLGSHFYCVVDLGTSVAHGGEMDADTVLWWLRQSDAARAEFSKKDGTAPHGILYALVLFSQFLRRCGPLDDVRVWGNGAAFDNVILASAYRAAEIELPWRHWNDRCYRTFKAQRPDVKLVRTGTHHNALHDAESQARHMLELSPKKAPISRETSQEAMERITAKVFSDAFNTHSDFKSRLGEELCALRLKLANLRLFREGPVHKTLSVLDQELLLAQERIMADYVELLEVRIFNLGAPVFEKKSIDATRQRKARLL